MNNAGLELVVGSDNIAPIYDPEGTWRWWAINEIWTGTTGSSKYVPKVDDYVIDPGIYEVFIVEFVDPVTLIPTLRLIRPNNMSVSFSETDILFGINGNDPSNYVCYLDNSVTPHVLAVDKRLKVSGSMCSYVKIFKGTDCSQLTGHVLSKTYDAGGNYISENVPLSLVAIDTHINYSIKSVDVCHCTEDLLDGELVTVVTYSSQGHVVSKRQLLVENTSFIRSLNDSQKYVSHISLESPFMSAGSDHVIEFPLNIPINALNAIGVVHYSDGSIMKLPVSDPKFKLIGMEQYVSSIIGQKVELVLSYNLSASETAYAGINNGIDQHYVTEPYTLVTTNPNNSYTVKLFCYPVFIDAINGYSLRWFLFTLDRNVVFDVTDKVRFSANTGAFNPLGYGYLQRKSVYLDLSLVSGAFKRFMHIQLVDIVLNDEPNDGLTSWTIAHESIASRPVFGEGLHVSKISYTTINISSGITDFTEWKQRVYLNAYPLINQAREVVSPNPTHFVVSVNEVTMEFPISEWHSNLFIGTNVGMYKTVFIEFIKKTSTGTMHLSVSAMLVKL
jgi:hypothetical protein